MQTGFGSTRSLGSSKEAGHDFHLDPAVHDIWRISQELFFWMRDRRMTPQMTGKPVVSRISWLYEQGDACARQMRIAAQ